MRKLTTGQKVMIAVVFLVILTAVMLFLSTGGEDTKAHAATVQAAGFRHCTKKHPCTKKQARARIRYANHGHDGGARHVNSRAVKPQVRSAATSCRTWRPRIYYNARAGHLYWRGAVAHWCFNWKRVTSARFTLDHDITTGGRILGFDGVSIEEPTIGYYNYAGHKNGGYLIYARFTFTQCIPVIQIGPLCNDRRAWLKELVHYDGSGYASGNAP
jgi:hypothetical protein